jgi:hypothetical protein
MKLNRTLALNKETLHTLASTETRDIAIGGVSFRCSQFGQICFTREGPTLCTPDGCFTKDFC